MRSIRPPAVAGSFYPEEKAVLQRQVAAFMAQAGPAPIDGDIKALIAPHAGYIYSGQVAAFAYKALEGRRYPSIVVIAPSHYVPFAGASIYAGDGYQLPGGVVELDKQLCRRIIEQAEGLVKFTPAAHNREHSLEVQLPFLQATQPGFKLVPIVMGSQDMNTCRRLARAIAQALQNDKALLVASSDLSHYHSYDEAVELDKVVQKHIGAFDPEGLARAVAQGECEACGAGPMVTVMLAAKQLGADSAAVLHYANSGDVSGDTSHVVGYMAGAFYAASTNG